MMRSRRLLAETTLEGEEIQDGAASVFRLPRPIEAASSRSLSIEIESLDGRPGESVSPAVGGRLYEGRILSANRSLPRAKRNGLLVLDFLTRSAIARKSFAFVSGCPGDAHRYRCEHQAEMLRLQGYAVDVFPADVMPFSRLLESYQVVVCHRVPHTREFEAFVEAARERKVRVVFDTDDLVFAPEVEHQIAALDDLSPSERDLWLDGVRRYRRSLLLCDAIVVSTPGLQESIRRRFEVEPFLSRNRASDEMVQAAERARKSRQHSGRALRLAYLSGTATHERDFAQCVPALRAVMERHPTVHLVLAGYIRVPTELLDFEDRVDRVPFMPWQQLPELYATIDVNLAPLEPDNEFTEGKSELKYFEAALVGVPTLASPVGGFRDAIRHGQNGFLCGTREEWTTALEQIVAQPSLRERIGRTAMEDAYRRYTSRGGASETVAMWLDLLGAHPEPGAKLSIAWVLRAPIANTGGGYKKVFHLVEHLASRGHEVTVYVEPIAHLEGLSEPEIEAFCRTHFECGAATIRVGHESIADCDVAIATNWPTAYVVDRLANARLRAYLVQDDEGEFYGREDPLRREAAATYDLPLLIVGMGRYLAELFGGRNRLSYPHVDFALDDAFFEARDAVEQKLAGLATTKTPSLLFFARPGIPRRAFELGVEALTRFHEARPDVEIRLYGLDEPRDLPFPYVDLGIVDQSTTAAEMRRASVHLSFSRTNASTVMFEAMASGAVAVELDAPGVRSLLDDPSTCLLCDDSPSAVARALEELFGDGRRMERIARAGLASASRLSVESMCRQFEEILVHHALGTRDD
ncbi:MAG: glycosyltransferase family 4 protein [Myxococcota bacterium]